MLWSSSGRRFFALKKTRASGRNVGKVFNPVVKLVLENQLRVGGISVYLVNFGVYWIPIIIGGLNRDTEIPTLFGFTWYELHL